MLDEPLPRIRPVRPPAPDWEPELVVKDEPLPRIRPVRPPDSNWEPDLIVGADAASPGSSASRLQTPGVSRPEDLGWLPGMAKPSLSEAPVTREAWYAIVGVTALVCLVILAIWMASPSTIDAPPTKPSDLNGPLQLPEMLPGPRQLPIPDFPDPPSGTPDGPRLNWPDLPSETGQSLPSH